MSPAKDPARAVVSRSARIDGSRRATASTPGAIGPASTWGLPLALFLVVFALFSVTAERHGVGTDAYAASAQGWRMATTGAPWFDGMDVKELQGVHNPIELGRWIVPASNGHVVAHRMAGPVLAALPFYVVLDQGGATSASAFSLGPASIAAATWTAGDVVLLFLALRRRVSAGLAAAGALAYAFATPTWAVSANGVWTHTVIQFGLAGAAWALSGRRWGTAGVFIAVGMLGRPHLALVAAVLGLGLAWSHRRWAPAVRIALPTVASLGLLSVWNHWMFGNWSLTGGGYGGKVAGAAQGFTDAGYDDVSNSQLLNLIGFFVSPGRGLLVWTPVVLLFLPAIVRARKQLPAWSVWLAVGGLLYTVAQLRVNHFGGGIAFYGYRHGLELVTCLVPALVFSVRRLGPVARCVIPPVLAAQVAAISIGSVNEAYFLQVSRVWNDNGFWVALRYQPDVVGGWLAILLAMGILISVMINRDRHVAAD